MATVSLFSYDLIHIPICVKSEVKCICLIPDVWSSYEKAGLPMLSLVLEIKQETDDLRVLENIRKCSRIIKCTQDTRSSVYYKLLVLCLIVFTENAFV